MSRLALSDADKEARDWFIETTRSLECKTVVDAMGNMYALPSPLGHAYSRHQLCRSPRSSRRRCHLHRFSS